MYYPNEFTNQNEFTKENITFCIRTPLFGLLYVYNESMTNYSQKRKNRHSRLNNCRVEGGDSTPIHPSRYTRKVFSSVL